MTKYFLLIFCSFFCAAFAAEPKPTDPWLKHIKKIWSETQKQHKEVVEAATFKQQNSHFITQTKHAAHVLQDASQTQHAFDAAQAFYEHAKELKKDAQKNSKRLNPQKFADFSTSIQRFKKQFATAKALLQNFSTKYPLKQTCDVATQTEEMDLPTTPFDDAQSPITPPLTRPRSESVSTTVSDVSVATSLTPSSFCTTDSEKNEEVADLIPEAPQEWNDVFKYSIEKNCWSIAEQMAKTTKLQQSSLDFALFRASGAGYVDGVKLFMQKGASTNARQDGQTPLHIACANNSSDVVTELLKDPKTERDPVLFDGSTPAHQAALKGNSSLVSLLIQNGASVKQPDENGKTAMHYLRNSQYGFVGPVIVQIDRLKEITGVKSNPPLSKKVEEKKEVKTPQPKRSSALANPHSAQAMKARLKLQQQLKMAGLQTQTKK